VKKASDFPKLFYFVQNFYALKRYIGRKVVRTLKNINKSAELERVINLYGRGVQALAYSYMKNRYDAEDVAQDVFLTYYQKAPYFENSHKEKSWLMTVTVNRCKSLLRCVRRQEEPLPEDLSYLPKLEMDLMNAMLHLEEKYRIVLHLHYYEGYSIAQIGKLLRCPAATVGSRMSRGREKLKKELGEDYFEE
jgi:RNA polymerase sigma-70 factor (ECF subfamily)